MTTDFESLDAEAALQACPYNVGDLVEVRTRGCKEWSKCRVEGKYAKTRKSVNAQSDLVTTFFVKLSIRRVGKLKSGSKYPRFIRYGDDKDVRLYKKHNPLTANVFADFLDEEGFQEAAVRLREAFPLADGS